MTKTGKIETGGLEEAAGRVSAACAELKRLRAEFARCTAAASTGAQHTAALEQLREQRHELLAEAFADDVAADTGEVDTRIAEHERAHSEAIEAAAIARDATVVIQARIEAQHDLIEPLLADWREQAQQVLLQALDAAESDFGRAVSALGDPVARLTAIASMWTQITGKSVPADGREGLLEGLRGMGALRVRWDFSPLKRADVAAHYAPESYQGAGRFVVAWLDPSLADFGARELKDLRALLKVDEVQV
ncbi:hypothetical protein [Paraburkholderia youngii]|uniref:Uncharacterized protein n=1 Tax=Paraburkholderia youngii TaxID=2782701 RepID=A0A7Y6JZM5_9BURK|nr:hypothetical protein [Paraburkholderia youngii]NUY01702.1 hypothetical protein [Paraburkholderia youngii]